LQVVPLLVQPCNKLGVEEYPICFVRGESLFRFKNLDRFTPANVICYEPVVAGDLAIDDFPAIYLGGEIHCGECDINVVLASWSKERE